MGGRRIELLTSSVSRKRSTSELTTLKMKKPIMNYEAFLPTPTIENGSPNGIRTRVLALRGLRPRSLVDGAITRIDYENTIDIRLFRSS